MSNIPEVIGEGSYGCVHSPSLHCEDNMNIDYDDKVSKIMDQKYALQELSEYVGIEKADPDQKYYLGKPILCKPDTSEITKTAINKCESEFSDKALLIMKDGGLNLRKLTMGWSKMPITPELINEVSDFWLETHKLLIGLKLFLANDIVHHDLKAENIVYNKKTKSISFIDFGHMRPLSKFVKHALGNKSRIAHAHWSYPWENTFITKNNYYAIAGYDDDDKTNYANLIYKHMNFTNNEYGAFMHLILPKNNNLLKDTNYSEDEKNELTIENQIEYFRRDYLDFLLKSKPENYDSFLKKATETFDLFGVGLALAFSWQQTAHILLHTHINVATLNGAIFGMIRPDVYDRYDVDTAIAIYEKILEPLAEVKGLAFQNNILKPKVVSSVPIVKPKSISEEEFEKMTQKADENLKKICPAEREMNPLTGRCVKKCKTGKYRNSRFRCVGAKKTLRKKSTKTTGRTVSVRASKQTKII
jgi:serine/threonine protein kinase